MGVEPFSRSANLLSRCVDGPRTKGCRPITLNTSTRERRTSDDNWRLGESVSTSISFDVRSNISVSPFLRSSLMRPAVTVSGSLALDTSPATSILPEYDRLRYVYFFAFERTTIANRPLLQPRLELSVRTINVKCNGVSAEACRHLRFMVLSHDPTGLLEETRHDCGEIPRGLG